jgi:hypothetical protein
VFKSNCARLSTLSRGDAAHLALVLAVRGEEVRFGKGANEEVIVDKCAGCVLDNVLRGAPSAKLTSGRSEGTCYWCCIPSASCLPSAGEVE